MNFQNIPEAALAQMNPGKYSSLIFIERPDNKILYFIKFKQYMILTISDIDWSGTIESYGLFKEVLFSEQHAKVIFDFIETLQDQRNAVVYVSGNSYRIVTSISSALDYIYKGTTCYNINEFNSRVVKELHDEANRRGILKKRPIDIIVGEMSC